MKRFFVGRNRRVAVEDVEGVLAIRIATDDQGRRMARVSDFGRSATRASGTGEPPLRLSAEQLTSFDRAGWAFIVPSARTVRAFEQRALPEGVAAAGQVLLREDGQIVIVTEQLTIKLRPELSEAEAEQMLRDLRLEPIRRLRFAPNLYEVRNAGARDAIDRSAELADIADVEYAEPTLLEPITGRFTPTDPGFRSQWQWQSSVEDGGDPDADIDIEAAWDSGRGTGVRVAIIDNGFDIQHPDLREAIDESTSGYFDNAGNFRQSLVNYPGDLGDHGTFCAGMAAARSNNGTGGCGAAPECELILVATLPDQVGSQTTLARAVAYCASPQTELDGVDGPLGVDVISCSLGPSSSDAWYLSSVLEDAITFATSQGRGGRGTPILWASSNGNVSISSDRVVSHPRVIAIGRSNRDNEPDNSAFGPELDLLAPGRDVYSTRNGGGYGTKVGTSFAAPCAAGVAGLLIEAAPDLQWNEVRDLLCNTADKIGNGYDATGHSERAGFGRINARRAVEVARSGGVARPVGRPFIEGPAVSRRREQPTFRVDPRPHAFYAVEVATDALLFNRAINGARRTSDNFFASWQEDDSFREGEAYRLPSSVWERLSRGPRLYYRIWANGRRDEWFEPIVSTPDSQFEQSPVICLVPSIEGPAVSRRREQPTFRVDPRPHAFYAVEVATDASLFNRAINGARRTSDNFFASWQEDDSFREGEAYRLPSPVWERLSRGPRLYYRIWANGRRDEWFEPIVSTPDSQFSFALSLKPEE